MVLPIGCPHSVGPTLLDEKSMSLQLPRDGGWEGGQLQTTGALCIYMYIFDNGQYFLPHSN